MIDSASLKKLKIKMKNHYDEYNEIQTTTFPIIKTRITCRASVSKKLLSF
jgi:hypothetical protein